MGSASKKLLRERPSEQEMRNTLLSIAHAPDAAFAITAVSYLDDALEALLLMAFRDLSKDEKTRFFDGSSGGLLAGTNAKIRVASALQLIPQEIYKDLLLMNDIRNVFGHTLHSVDFKNELIAKDCQSLRAWKDSESKDDINSSKHQFLFTYLHCYLFIYNKTTSLLKAKTFSKELSSP